MTGPELRVGIVGHGFIARAHSLAWSAVSRAFPLPVHPRLTVLAGRDRAAAEAAAARLGWASVTADWGELVARPDVDLVDICAPDELHAPIAIAALEAGKHVLCEKPLASSVAEATTMAAAAERASSRGVRAMIGFNYRRVPAIELARQLISGGRLGRITHVRASYLQDWLASPDGALNWKLDPARAPLGALSDLGSHIVDLVQHLSGRSIERVLGVASLENVVDASGDPQVDSDNRGALSRRAARGSALFLGQIDGGLTASFEVSRVSAGSWNDLRLDISGTEGALRFTLERLNELEVFDRSAPASQHGFRNILATDPRHPWIDVWWPPGHIIGWEHSFTHEVAAFIEDIAEGRDSRPSFADGLQVQRVIDSVVRSSETQTWVDVISS